MSDGSINKETLLTVLQSSIDKITNMEPVPSIELQGIIDELSELIPQVEPTGGPMVEPTGEGGGYRRRYTQIKRRKRKCSMKKRKRRMFY
jgi:hypothetical protein